MKRLLMLTKRALRRDSHAIGMLTKHFKSFPLPIPVLSRGRFSDFKFATKGGFPHFQDIFQQSIENFEKLTAIAGQCTCS